MTKEKHIPVLMQEFLSFFKDLKIKVFVDGTLGAGGHSLALLQNHPEIEKLVGFDQDQSAIEIAKGRLSPFKEKVIFVQKNFCDMDLELKKLNIHEVDGIFLDIGVSSMQLDQAERGFSFSKEGPLDMRMDKECELTAKDIVNDWSEKELGEIFRDFGDLQRWRFIAKKIVESRAKKKLETTKELVDLLSPHLRKSSKKSIHPLTLVFQALRIAVNNELKVLSYSLPICFKALKKKGRLGVISFHSGEDRIVKNTFRAMANEGQLKLLNKKPLGPQDEECKLNPRARSSKMRFVEKI